MAHQKSLQLPSQIRSACKARKTPDNLRYAEIETTCYINSLIAGGGGSHRRTCLCFAFPCCAGKYRENSTLEAGCGEAALALANKFKSFFRISLTLGTGNFAEQTENWTYRNNEVSLERRSLRTRLKRARRGDIVGQERGCWPSMGSSATIPVSGLAWRKLRTWRRSRRCISVVAMEGTKMFTTKPEAGEKITKLGGAMRRRPSPSGRRPMLPRAPAQVRARWSRRSSART